MPRISSERNPKITSQKRMQPKQSAKKNEYKDLYYNQKKRAVDRGRKRKGEEGTGEDERGREGEEKNFFYR